MLSTQGEHPHLAIPPGEVWAWCAYRNEAEDVSAPGRQLRRGLRLLSVAVTEPYGLSCLQWSRSLCASGLEPRKSKGVAPPCALWHWARSVTFSVPA